MLHREVDLKEDQWKMCEIGALIILGLFAMRYDGDKCEQVSDFYCLR